MNVRPALLEEWFRSYYFNTEIDIGSSGVEPFSMAELRSRLGISPSDLDRIVFRDSESLGGVAIRQAIARRYANGDESRVLVSHGSSEAMFLIIHSLLKPGDEVIAQDPAYQQFCSTAESVGCSVRYWRLRFEDGFAADLDLLESLITHRTRMIIVNFPHNPTGCSVTQEQQKRIVTLAERHGCYLLWDAAFAELVYDRPVLSDPSNSYDQCLSLGTLSKAFGLPGLRVGWCLGDPALLRRFIKLRDHITLHLSPLTEYIAARAIAPDADLVGLRRPMAEKNLRILTDWMSRHREFVEWVPPAGGVTAFPRLTAVPDVEKFCHDLARKNSVLLVPGNCFRNPEHVRIGFGTFTDIFEKALTILSRTLVAAAEARLSSRYS